MYNPVIMIHNIMLQFQYVFLVFLNYVLSSSITLSFYHQRIGYMYVCIGFIFCFTFSAQLEKVATKSEGECQCSSI